ncbi:hypothetical protein BP00DRAFT_147245 [Aspergillus indologenus CBS 114.80]|uniref:Uncharacterized protein n=1 Tax=Aspergillus indologenus CBS 114.80 TaxID=1450541 RepID=A0A2V5IEU3_9EURO|nr:hypothetical protein BP00DRAFT_147245 [Aspergillus indologenus CBS 114.80]
MSTVLCMCVQYPGAYGCEVDCIRVQFHISVPRMDSTSSTRISYCELSLVGDVWPCSFLCFECGRLSAALGTITGVARPGGSVFCRP